jgi:hypothetical protein
VLKPSYARFFALAHLEFLVPDLKRVAFLRASPALRCQSRPCPRLRCCYCLGGAAASATTCAAMFFKQHPTHHPPNKRSESITTGTAARTTRWRRGSRRSATLATCGVGSWRRRLHVVLDIWSVVGWRCICLELFGGDGFGIQCSPCVLMNDLDLNI